MLPLPTGVTVSVSEAGVQLTWNAVAGATSYEIRRRTNSQTFASAVVVSTTANTSLSDNSIIRDVVYFYYVRAVSASDTSDWVRSVAASLLVAFLKGDQFTEPTQTWLNNHMDIGQYRRNENGNRHLGPSFNTRNDIYPFLDVCPYSGLFATLQIYGLNPEDEHIQITHYYGNMGFTADVPGWQFMQASDWVDQVETAGEEIQHFHPADIAFSNGIDTSSAEYSFNECAIGRDYIQQSWTNGTITIIAVTFAAIPEFSEPFIRPKNVEGLSAYLDPICVNHFLDASLVPLVGRWVFNEGENVTLTADSSTNTITINKLDTSDVTPYILTVNSVPPNPFGNIALTSDGCHVFGRHYDIIDEPSSTVTLAPNEISIENVCSSCCTCCDYVTTYEILRRLATGVEIPDWGGHLPGCPVVEFHPEDPVTGEDRTLNSLVEKINQTIADIQDLQDQIAILTQKKSKLIKAVITSWAAQGSSTDIFITLYLSNNTKAKKVFGTVSVQIPGATILSAQKYYCPPSISYTGSTGKTIPTNGSDTVTFSNLTVTFLGNEIYTMKVNVAGTVANYSSVTPVVIC